MQVTILGCNSALPSINSFQSAQMFHFHEKQFLIDCGEGTQIRLRQFTQKTSRLNHIFISHLHGDHCFGLIGLITTLGMLGRTADLVIHSQSDLEKLLQPQIDYYCPNINFNIRFEPFNTRIHSLLYEDRSLQVFSIPLKHRVPASGFLFVEKEKDRHIIREMIDFYQIPVKDIMSIKQGADFMTPNGEIIPNAKFTTPPTPPKKYAFCSDTVFYEKIIQWIEGVDLLYHEATFLHQDIVRAKETGHSSARQAAEIAKKAQVNRLLIGHFSARYTDLQPLLHEAQSIFPNTELAHDGMKIVL